MSEPMSFAIDMTMLSVLSSGVSGTHFDAKTQLTSLRIRREARFKCLKVAELSEENSANLV